jgi:hypothetical protein
MIKIDNKYVEVKLNDLVIEIEKSIHDFVIGHPEIDSSFSQVIHDSLIDMDVADSIVDKILEHEFDGYVSIESLSYEYC